MAQEVTWSVPALRDLEEIRDYIARDSEFYAAGFTGRGAPASGGVRTNSRVSHHIASHERPVLSKSVLPFFSEAAWTDAGPADVEIVDYQ